MYTTSSLLSAMWTWHRAAAAAAAAPWPQYLGRNALSQRSSASWDTSWGHLWTSGGRKWPKPVPIPCEQRLLQLGGGHSPGNCAQRQISASPFGRESLGNWRVAVHFLPHFLLPCSSWPLHSLSMVWTTAVGDTSADEGQGSWWTAEPHSGVQTMWVSPTVSGTMIFATIGICKSLPWWQFIVNYVYTPMISKPCTKPRARWTLCQAERYWLALKDLIVQAQVRVGGRGGPLGTQHLTMSSLHLLAEAFQNFNMQCLTCLWERYRENYNSPQPNFSSWSSEASVCCSHRHQDETCWSSWRNSKEGLQYNKLIIILPSWLFAKGSEDVESNISSEWYY